MNANHRARARELITYVVERNGSIGAAADAIGLHPNYLRNYLAGRCETTPALELEEFFGRSVDDCFEASGHLKADLLPAKPAATDPVESRKRRPDLWKAYDEAGKLSFAFVSDGLVVAATSTGGDAPVAHPDATANATELLDLLRSLLRERIEADAAREAGK